MARKSGLGKGLDALISSDSSIIYQNAATNFIPISKIVPNPRQPRHSISEEALKELAASIKEHGILQPLLVTHEPEMDQYILIAGERRLYAAKIAGLEAVPVIERAATEQQRLELALIENIQRADLTPLETADAYKQLNEEFNLSHEEIATQVGKSRVAITNTLRLLKLPEIVRAALAVEKISEGHARALLGLNSQQAQGVALETIIKHSLTVRQTEELVRRLNGQKVIHHPKQSSPEVLSIEEKLRDSLGTKVTLRHGQRGGSIIIHFYSDEELDTLLSKLTGD